MRLADILVGNILLLANLLMREFLIKVQDKSLAHFWGKLSIARRTTISFSPLSRAPRGVSSRETSSISSTEAIASIFSTLCRVAIARAMNINAEITSQPRQPSLKIGNFPLILLYLFPCFEHRQTEGIFSIGWVK
jgi:hypothetical protein